MTVRVGTAALVRDVLSSCPQLLYSCILHTFVTWYASGLHGDYIFLSLVHRHGPCLGRQPRCLRERLRRISKRERNREGNEHRSEVTHHQ
jgi:hypothetical protein